MQADRNRIALVPTLLGLSLTWALAGALGGPGCGAAEITNLGSTDGAPPTENTATADATAEGLSDEPPRIIVTDRPALLLYVDGEPLARPLPGTRFERIANTPLAVARDPADGGVWLSHGGRWYHAPAIDGPWAVAEATAEVRALGPALRRADDDTGNDDETDAGTGADDDAGGAPLAIVVSHEPADLVSSDGPLTFAAIPGLTLEAVSNSDSRLFRDPASGQHYLLLSGRWYAAADPRTGPWRAVPPDGLPVDFARIPPDSPQGAVLVHVPGTSQAQAAAQAALEPQVATVRRDATIVVPYDGAPQWRPVPDTSLAYAINSPLAVLRASDRDYYCCAQGVWYSAPTPAGPWLAATARPPGIERLPPSNPLYHVRYVYVYRSTAEFVEIGYAPGYLGCYVEHGRVVWGTGYRYAGWRGQRYYARPLTWGCAWTYDPRAARWGVGVRYAPRDLPRQPAGGWWGPGGFRTVPAYRVPAGAPQAGQAPAARPAPTAGPTTGAPATLLQTARPTDDNLYRRRANRDRVVQVIDTDAQGRAPAATAPAKPGHPSPGTQPATPPTGDDRTPPAPPRPVRADPDRPERESPDKPAPPRARPDERQPDGRTDDRERRIRDGDRDGRDGRRRGQDDDAPPRPQPPPAKPDKPVTEPPPPPRATPPEPPRPDPRPPRREREPEMPRPDPGSPGDEPGQRPPRPERRTPTPQQEPPQRPPTTLPAPAPTPVTPPPQRKAPSDDGQRVPQPRPQPVPQTVPERPVPAPSPSPGTTPGSVPPAPTPDVPLRRPRSTP